MLYLYKSMFNNCYDIDWTLLLMNIVKSYFLRHNFSWILLVS